MCLRSHRRANEPNHELSLLCEPAREGLDNGLLQSRLQHALRQQTGLSIAVQVLERDRVPRSEGKAVRVWTGVRGNERPSGAEKRERVRSG